MVKLKNISILNLIILSLFLVSNTSYADNCSTSASTISDRTYTVNTVEKSQESITTSGNVVVNSGIQVTYTASVITLSSGFSAVSGSSLTVLAKAVTCTETNNSNYAVLTGKLSNSNISIYTLHDLNVPSLSNSISNSDGLFTLDLSSLNSSDIILVEAQGGTDNGNVNSAHLGKLYAMGQASGMGDGIYINYLTDIAWRYSKNLVGKIVPVDLLLRLNQIAKVLLREDINGDNIINYIDLLKYNPGNSEHQLKLNNDFANLLQGELLIAYLAGDTAQVDILYQEILGPWLLQNPALPTGVSQYRLDLQVFGDAKVTDSQNNTVFDSTQNDNAEQYLFYTPNDAVTLTVTPVSGYTIHSWKGCTNISSDMLECQINLDIPVNQVQLYLVTEQIDVSDKFKDLSSVYTAYYDGETKIISIWDSVDTDSESLIKSVQVNDFITGSAGDGFLKKVTSITEASTYRLFDVVDASLADVIESGSAYFNRQITHSDLEVTQAATIQKRNGINYQTSSGLTAPEGTWLENAKPESNQFIIHFGSDDNLNTDENKRISGEASFDVIVYDKDGDNLTTTDQVSINGTLTLELTADLGIEVKGLLPPKLQTFKFVPKIDMTQELTAKYGVGLEYKYSNTNRKLVSTLKFTAIKFMAGPVPVFITHQLNIYLGWNGKIETSITTDVKMKESIEAGIVYKRDAGGWQVVGNANTNFDFNFMPSFTATAEVRGIMEPEYATQIYGIAGPALSVQAYAGASIQSVIDTSNLCTGSGLSYNFFIGLEGKLKFVISPKIVNLFNLEDSSELSLTYLDLSKSLLKGEKFNTCPSAGQLRITENTIANTYPIGSNNIVSKIYTLKNEGEQDLNWSLEYNPDSTVSIQPSSGSLSGGSQVTVNADIDLSNIPDDSYSKVVYFKNESNSNQETQEKILDIKLVSQLAQPIITTAVINSSNSNLVDLAWSINEQSLIYLQGFTLYVNGVPYQSFGKNLRSSTISGLPKGVNLNLQIQADSSDSVNISQLSVIKSITISGIEIYNNCVTYNGLMWEVKTNDGGLQDKGWTYTFYDSSRSYSGYANNGSCDNNLDCDTEKYVTRINSQRLCGFNNWRLPTISELENLVYTGNSPTIDTPLFPNTMPSEYWSSTQNDNWYTFNHSINFANGVSFISGATSKLYVRLVRTK